MTDETSPATTTLRLAGAGVLPDLRIVPRAAVALHEDADPARVRRLAVSLRTDGVLRNPPIAALGGDGAFVVLDGANRVSALDALQIPMIPLQAVSYEDPAIRLEVWRHLIVEPLDLAAALRGRGIPLERTARPAAAQALRDHAIAAYAVTPEASFAVPLSPARPLAAVLAEVVGAYRDVARIYRVPTDDYEALAREFGEVAAVVVFPSLDKQDVLTIAASPAKLPTGVTRHIIPGRALRLNLPLDALRTPGDVGATQRWLANLVRERLREHRVRYYPEGAFLFDE